MPEANVYILSGPVRSGKTTSLLQWAGQRADVYGILTPEVNGKRVFMDAQSKEQFPMEAVSAETAIMTVGRFAFSKAGFDKAIKIIRENIKLPGWLVIDEIGPLELREEGFHDVLKETLDNRTGNTLLVVREEMVQAVQAFFNIKASLIKSISGLQATQNNKA